MDESTQNFINVLMQQQQMQEQMAQQEETRKLAAAHEYAARRMNQAALNDPRLRHLMDSLEAPVKPFQPERPQSYAPGAAEDIGTLRGAFGTPSGAPSGASPVGPNDRVQLDVGDVSFDPKTEGAFTSSQASPEKVYETVVRGERNRVPTKGGMRMPGRPGGVTRAPQRPPGETPPELSPEGFDMYAKLAPSLVSRRNNEETTRRTLEGEQMRGDTSSRNAQLRSATDLVREQMRLAAAADALRQKRMGAKSKDEALKWADQERDARLTAMNAANHVVQQYQYALTDPNDPQMRQAMQAAAEAARAYAASEQDFNALRSERGMNPKGKTLKAPGSTKSYGLDANGQLVPQ